MMSDPPRLVESIEGRGYLYAGENIVGEVEYGFDVYRTFADKPRSCPNSLTGSDLGRFVGEVLILELHDGRRTEVVLSQVSTAADCAVGIAQPPE
jgi:hypothetical protein